MYANTLNVPTDHVITSSSAMCKTTPYTIPFYVTRRSRNEPVSNM
jgi:hypothetical protein